MILYFELLSGPAGLSQARAAVTTSRPLSAAGTGLATAGPLPSCSPLPWAQPGARATSEAGGQVSIQHACGYASRLFTCTAEAGLHAALHQLMPASSTAEV